MDTATQCMITVSSTCDAAIVVEWELEYHLAISLTAGSSLITNCVNVCATNPCHNGGLCVPADNDDGFTCKCPPTYLKPYCVGGE